MGKTCEAIRRLVLAWGGWRQASVEYRHVRSESAMTDEQKKHFDAAFSHMDKAFEEMEKVFK